MTKKEDLYVVKPATSVDEGIERYIGLYLYTFNQLLINIHHDVNSIGDASGAQDRQPSCD